MAKKSPLKVLPITEEELRDPRQFSNWIFTHSPLVLQALFDALPTASPNEQLKTLSTLFSTIVSYKPILPQKAEDGDAVSRLMQVLSGKPQEPK